jgi:hypothetical protein
MTEDDRDLREHFAALRREEESRVPPIAILSLNGRRRFSGKLIAAAVCLAVSIAPFVWLLPGLRVNREVPNRGHEQASASITSWKPATDFLLDTPGRELLQGVPAIGDVPTPGESHRPSNQPVLP